MKGEGRRPLLGERAYRALSGDARGLLHGAWILVSDSPERGVLRDVRIGGRGGIADEIGMNPRLVARVTPELLRHGWLRLNPDPTRTQVGVDSDLGRTQVRVDLDWTADWHLPDAPSFNPSWVLSTERTRAHRERLKAKQLELQAQAQPGLSLGSGGAPDGTDAGTFRERSQPVPLKEEEGEDLQIPPPPPPRPAAGNVPRAAVEKARAEPFHCGKCHHLHLRFGARSALTNVDAGACPKCSCKRVAPFAKLEPWVLALRCGRCSSGRVNPMAGGFVHCVACSHVGEPGTERPAETPVAAESAAPAMEGT